MYSMFKSISTILVSKNPNLYLLKATLILGILLVLYILWRISAPPYKKAGQEGFTQKEQFVLKQDQQVYDGFYAEVYDGLNETTKVGQAELLEVIHMTEPTAQHSVFLDVGSGTGCLTNLLTEAGYVAYGIEKSQAMVDYSEKLYPNITIESGNVLDPMSFDRLTFTHVLCTNMTIYQFPDKGAFFRNCYSWMMPNGYLVVHLVEPDKFSIRGSKDTDVFTWLSTPKTRTLDTMNEYYDFKYAASYRFPTHTNSNSTQEVVFQETFTDRDTGHVRQNEQTLYMDSMHGILDQAAKAGFLFHAKMNLLDTRGDEHQYLYVFERPM